MSAADFRLVGYFFFLQFLSFLFFSMCLSLSPVIHEHLYTYAVHIQWAERFCCETSNNDNKFVCLYLARMFYIYQSVGKMWEKSRFYFPESLE